MLCSSSFKIFLCGYFIFYFKIEKKITLKKEKFENSLLHGKDKDLKVREIKSIAYFFWHLTRSSVTEPLLQCFGQGYIYILKTQRACLCCIRFFSPVCKLAYSFSSLSISPCGPTAKVHLWAHWADVYTIHEFTDRFTHPLWLVPSLRSTRLDNTTYLIYNLKPIILCILQIPKTKIKLLTTNIKSNASIDTFQIVNHSVVSNSAGPHGL